MKSVNLALINSEYKNIVIYLKQSVFLGKFREIFTNIHENRENVFTKIGSKKKY